MCIFDTKKRAKHFVSELSSLPNHHFLAYINRAYHMQNACNSISFWSNTMCVIWKVFNNNTRLSMNDEIIYFALNKLICHRLFFRIRFLKVSIYQLQHKPKSEYMVIVCMRAREITLESAFASTRVAYKS